MKSCKIVEVLCTKIEQSDKLVEFISSTRFFVIKSPINLKIFVQKNIVSGQNFIFVAKFLINISLVFSNILGLFQKDFKVFLCHFKH